MANITGGRQFGAALRKAIVQHSGGKATRMNEPDYGRPSSYKKRRRNTTLNEIYGL